MLARHVDIAPTLGYTPPAGQTFEVVRTSILALTALRTGTFATSSASYTPDLRARRRRCGVPRRRRRRSRSTTRPCARAQIARSSSGAPPAPAPRPSTGRCASTAPRRPTPGLPARQRRLSPGRRPGVRRGRDAARRSRDPDARRRRARARRDVPVPPVSHPTNMPIARADATGDDPQRRHDFQSVSPNVLPNTGPITRDPARRRPDEPDDGQAALQRTSPTVDQPVSFTPVRRRPVGHGRCSTRRAHADGRRTGTSSSTPSTTAQLRQPPGDVEASTRAAKPSSRPSCPPFARGGVHVVRLPHFGNVGKGASRPAFVRFSGYPAGADLKVDHLPAGARTRFADGIAGRTVLVSVGKIAGAGQQLHPHRLHADDDDPRPHEARAAGRR